MVSKRKSKKRNNLETIKNIREMILLYKDIISFFGFPLLSMFEMGKTLKNYYTPPDVKASEYIKKAEENLAIAMDIAIRDGNSARANEIDFFLTSLKASAERLKSPRVGSAISNSVPPVDINQSTQ
jgi:hypothetical protein